MKKKSSQTGYRSKNSSVNYPPTPQHTPGPWKVQTDSKGQIDVVAEQRFGGTRFVTAVGHKDSPDKASIDADARLIAATPDLLRAVELHEAFLKSLPHGWLGKTTGDVGLLNEALLVSARALSRVRGTNA